MVAAPFLADTERHRPMTALGAVAIAVAVAALGMRAADAADHPMVFLRLVLGAAAIAMFFFARRSSLRHRMALALGLEIAGGGLVFAFVDVPFLQAHAPQIARMSVNAVLALERRTTATTAVAAVSF